MSVDSIQRQWQMRFAMARRRSARRPRHANQPASPARRCRRRLRSAAGVFFVPDGRVTANSAPWLVRGAPAALTAAQCFERLLGPG